MPINHTKHVYGRLVLGRNRRFRDRRWYAFVTRRPRDRSYGRCTLCRGLNEGLEIRAVDGRLYGLARENKRAAERGLPFDDDWEFHGWMVHRRNGGFRDWRRDVHLSWIA